ncbi:MAG: DUF4854 domain-containing protein [Lachnospiraceae bacterium]|nr:DUF4854 domain-containing protein [Lachnospiraceae bacterium]
MKKNRLTVMVGMIMIALSLAACSKSNGKTTADSGNNSSNPSGESAIVVDPGTEKKEVKEYNTLEEFFLDEDNADNTDLMIDKSQYEGIFSDIKVSVEENRIIYEYFYTDFIDDETAESLKNTAESTKDSLFASLRKAVNTKELMEIEFIYYNSNGSLATDFVLSESEKTDKPVFSSNAKEGSIQYLYESSYGPDYWKSVRENVLNQTSEIYSDIIIENNDNNIKYTFMFKDNNGSVQEELEAEFNDDYKKKLIDTYKNPFGFEDTIYVEYIYMNPDGSVAADIKFEG